MRFATVLSAAAIAAVTILGPGAGPGAGPALAYGPATSGPSLLPLYDGPPKASPDVETGRLQLAFAVVKKTAGWPGYLLIKNDPGSARPYPNCATSGKCTNESLEVLLSRSGTAIVELPCQALGGCAIVGGGGR